MAPARAPLEGPFSRSVREALESVAHPDVVQRILAMALQASSRTALPEDGGPLRLFVEGALRQVVVDMLGIASYEVVAERLGHVIAMAHSHVRPRPHDDALWEEDSTIRLTMPAPTVELELELDLDDLPRPPALPTSVETPPPSTRSSSQHLPIARVRASRPGSMIISEQSAAPADTRDSPPRADPRRGSSDTIRPPLAAPSRVLMLTLDPLLLEETVQRLRGKSRVVSVQTLAQLLAELAAGKGSVAIVLDTALPSIDVPTVASAAESLPIGATVVLWGMSERQKDRLIAMFPVARSWIASGIAGSPADIIAPD